MRKRFYAKAEKISKILTRFTYEEHVGDKVKIGTINYGYTQTFDGHTQEEINKQAIDFIHEEIKSEDDFILEDISNTYTILDFTLIDP